MAEPASDQGQVIIGDAEFLWRAGVTGPIVPSETVLREWLRFGKSHVVNSFPGDLTQDHAPPGHEPGGFV
jgi:hypothetical protein